MTYSHACPASGTHEKGGDTAHMQAAKVSGKRRILAGYRIGRMTVAQTCWQAGGNFDLWAHPYVLRLPKLKFILFRLRFLIHCRFAAFSPVDESILLPAGR